MKQGLVSGSFIGLLVAALAAPVSAFAWGDKAVTVWTARNDALAAAANAPLKENGSGQVAWELISHQHGSLTAADNADEAVAIQYINDLSAACDGLTMEHIKNGGRNMPTWAQTAQQSFCLSVADLKHAYKDKASDDDRCKSLKTAIKNAGKAERGDDPDAVVDSAAKLTAAAERLRSLPITLVKWSVLSGRSTRTFTCD